MQLAEIGRERTSTDGCRRYLIHAISFDSRARQLTEEIGAEWEPDVIALHKENLQLIRVGLIHQYGNDDHDRKINDYAALGAAPWSAVDQHSLFLEQIRDSFAFGAYYPALVGACALGERLLNELVIRLRNSYASHPATTEEVATYATFSDWVVCIKALVGWAVMDDPLATKFNDLRKFRNRSVHYGNHLVNSDARNDALTAVLLIQDIIETLFRPHGGPPRFIPGTTGHCFLSLSSEDEPFVREFLLPASVLVSPKFDMPFNAAKNWFDVLDDETYQDRFPTLSDEEFAEHRMNPRRAPVNQN